MNNSIACLTKLIYILLLNSFSSQIKTVFNNKKKNNLKDNNVPSEIILSIIV